MSAPGRDSPNPLRTGGVCVPYLVLLAKVLLLIAAEWHKKKPKR